MNSKAILAGIYMASLTVLAQINIPSDGSDLSLVANESTTIDLATARTGKWNENNSTAAGRGIYDKSKWAVVFKYSSVKIATNTTLSFANHPTHAPVVWLVDGDVTIDGTLSLDGSSWTSSVPEKYSPSEPGPGGFRGGAVGPLGTGGGYGPGGRQDNGVYAGSYGNPQIIPLIGGSGGGGVFDSWGVESGSGGGGAILIAAKGKVTINGKISARSPENAYPGNTGSAGAIRVIADELLGAGFIDCTSNGRTRVEANHISSMLNIFPNTSAVAPGTIPTLWPPDTAPTVEIISVDSRPAPDDPQAAVTTTSDIQIENNSKVKILMRARNLPIQGSAVSLQMIPKYGSATVVGANAMSGGTVEESFWEAEVTIPQGFVTFQARATAP